MDASTPAGFAAALGAQALTILPWVGVAVSAGLVLMFAFLGIRRGLLMHRTVVRHPGWIDTSGYDMGMEAPDVGVAP